MRVFYVVLAHRDARQLGELVRALRAPWARTVVHVDAAVDLAADLGEENLGGATFLDDRIPVNWGSWSIVEATLRMLRHIEDELADDDYVVLLSGDSYPLADQETIRTFLVRNSGSEFIHLVPFPADDLEKPLSRVSRFFIDSDAREGEHRLYVRAINRLGLPNPYRRSLRPYIPLCGAQWWTLSGGAIRWILGEARRNPRFVRLCRYSRVPDEFFFHTLLGASPYAENVRRSLMFADFTRPSGPQPAVLDDDHVKAFAESEDMTFVSDDGGRDTVLFARKTGSDAEATPERLRSVVWPVWATLVEGSAEVDGLTGAPG